MQTRYKLVASSKLYDYYAVSDGRILKYLKSNYREFTVTGHLHHHRTVVVKISGKDYNVKSLIAKAFIPGYKDGMIILNIDGNPWNNSVDNLKLMSRKKFNHIAGPLSRSQAVEVIYPSGEIKTYSSLRKAGKALFVSHQTINDYINGTYKSSVLEGYTFKKIN